MFSQDKQTQKCYKVFDINDDKMITSRDVRSFKDVFQFSITQTQKNKDVNKDENMFNEFFVDDMDINYNDE